MRCRLKKFAIPLRAQLPLWLRLVSFQRRFKILRLDHHHLSQLSAKSPRGQNYEGRHPPVGDRRYTADRFLSRLDSVRSGGLLSLDARNIKRMSKNDGGLFRRFGHLATLLAGVAALATPGRQSRQATHELKLPSLGKRIDVALRLSLFDGVFCVDQ